MLSVTDELLTYINMRSFHYILLIIKVDAARVEIYDSLVKDNAKYNEAKYYRSIIDVLQR